MAGRGAEQEIVVEHVGEGAGGGHGGVAIGDVGVAGGIHLDVRRGHLRRGASAYSRSVHGCRRAEWVGDTTSQYKYTSSKGPTHLHNGGLRASARSRARAGCIGECKCRHGVGTGQPLPPEH